MGDIFEVFTSLETQMQGDDLLLPDIFTCSSMAQRQFDLLSGTPYPGKRESKTTLPWENIQTQRARQRQKTLVPTNRRNESAIRIEITSSAKSFLRECLHLEQEEILLSMSELLSASTLGKLVGKGIGIVNIPLLAMTEE